MSRNPPASRETKEESLDSTRDGKRRSLNDRSLTRRKTSHRNSKAARSTTPPSMAEASMRSFGSGMKMAASPTPAASQRASRKRSTTIDGTTAVKPDDNQRETRKARTSSPKRSGTSSFANN